MNTRLEQAPEAIRPGKKRTAETDAVALRRELREKLRGEVRFDDGSRALYATDASNYRQVPIGVVIPRSTEDLITAVRVCRSHGAPLTNRGGGTGLVGNACNAAVILDCSKYLNRILEIDPERRIARVEPGVLLDDLRTAAEKHGLTFAPDPSTHAWCTIGGMLGNNACGIHSVMAGRTSDCTEAMEVLTYDGQRMTVGLTDEEQLDRLVERPDRIGTIYRELKAIRDEYATEIRQRYPDIPRRISGYNLDELLPENGFQVARSLVGTEGTCVTVLEATLKLVPSPPKRSMLALSYPSVYEAGDHVPQLMSFEPIGLEGLDDRLLDFMREKHLHLQYTKLLPAGGGWLLAEFGGQTQKEADDKARACMRALEAEDNPPEMALFDDPEEQAHVWEVRESGLAATAWTEEAGGTWPGWEDAAVPPERLGDYLRDFRALLDRYGYQCSLYGHFGQGCVHCRIDFDLASEEGIDRYRRFIDDAADLVVRYGGSFSAEHGDGQSKAAFLPRMYGERLMEAHRRFKRLWDPHWKMNPGKVIEPDPPDSNLRLGADYAPAEPRTHYAFPEDEHSFSHAALRCVGVGKCRRTDDAFMCPSYLVTREEKHTTRGRARMLFEMVHGGQIKDGWRSDAVKDSLDLCLACKGCKTECPVNVDMATYKSEFLSHYYANRVRPRSHYALGLIGWWARLGGAMPSLANMLSQRPPFDRLSKRAAGVAPERRLPAFAAEPFTRWCRRHRTNPRRIDRTAVVLYPDTFNDYFYPGTLRSALNVLERLGYSVHVPETPVPCIRPTLHYGMLQLGKRQLRRVVARLRPYVRRGVPVIGLEPSTVAVFRDELPRLLYHEADAQRVEQHSCLLSEFLVEREIEPPRVDRPALLHGHCHQKASLDMSASRSLLEKMGVSFEEPDPGCCGMAGSFGFEAEHYDVGMKIGERKLLPAVRRADSDTLILADGFSCRMQVREASNRRPVHLAELLDWAYTEKPRRPNSLPTSREVEAPVMHPAMAALAGAALIGGLAGSAYLMRKRR